MCVVMLAVRRYRQYIQPKLRRTKQRIATLTTKCTYTYTVTHKLPLDTIHLSYPPEKMMMMMI